MRILNVTESYAPFFEYGGPPVKVRALSEGLARRGHEVTVLTADWGLTRRLRQMGQGEAEHHPFGMCRVENGVKAIYFPNWLHYRALSWNPDVKRYCRDSLEKFDVVHIFGLYDLLGPAVAAACRARKIPYVVEPIGMFVPIVRNFRLKRMYHSVFGSRLFRGADRVIATSEQEFSELSAGGVTREKIVLRRNGVEIPGSLPARGTFRDAHGISRDAKLILFLGRLSQKKSPDLLLKAFAAQAAPEDRTGLQIVFAGPDESGMRERLERAAVQLGVRSRVHFTGPLFGEAKWGAFRDADLFVLPSQNENFGNTAAEAVAAGTPVIVTNRCGIAPLLADLAGLVVEHDQAALAKTMQRVLNEPGLLEKLSAGCRIATSRLGWEEPVQEMEQLYETLAARSSAGATSRPMG